MAGGSALGLKRQTGGCCFLMPGNSQKPKMGNGNSFILMMVVQIRKGLMTIPSNSKKGTPETMAQMSIFLLKPF